MLASGSIRILATPSTSASARSSSGSHSEVNQTVNSVSASTTSSCSAEGLVSRTRPREASRLSTRRAFMSGSGRFGSKMTWTLIRSGRSNTCFEAVGCSTAAAGAGGGGCGTTASAFAAGGSGAAGTEAAGADSG